MHQDGVNTPEDWCDFSLFWREAGSRGKLNGNLPWTRLQGCYIWGWRPNFNFCAFGGWRPASEKSWICHLENIHVEQFISCLVVSSKIVLLSMTKREIRMEIVRFSSINYRLANQCVHTSLGDKTRITKWTISLYISKDRVL